MKEDKFDYGSHYELLTNSKLYNQLYTLQKEKKVIERIVKKSL